MILGIAGMICAGKSTLAHQIARDGYFFMNENKIPLLKAKIIEVDQLGHLLLKEPTIKVQLRQAFGNDIFRNDTVDREALANITFASEQSLFELEAIMHPSMQEDLRRLMASAREMESNLIIVSALPQRFELFRLCDKVIILPIEKETAFDRLKTRSPYITERLFSVIWKRQKQEYS